MIMRMKRRQDLIALERENRNKDNNNPLVLEEITLIFGKTMK